ncbi:MAG: hypothetical protein R3336_00850 [Phycisphaeraceae bacterium]|nr:hypothetical protein [Phycisphaeraceae bacterium]
MNRITRKICSQCRYDLTGLDEIGRCPECGQLFNRRKGTGILDPDDPVNREVRRIEWVKAILLLSGAFILLVTTGLLWWLAPMGGYVVILLLPALICAGYGGIALWHLLDQPV